MELFIGCSSSSGRGFEVKILNFPDDAMMQAAVADCATFNFFYLRYGFFLAGAFLAGAGAFLAAGFLAAGLGADLTGSDCVI